ncbi:MAG: hypothetical protein HY907_11455 [Deltaproteobacteria bacterium]|nr:hypothetical protein [Deltaproteobacteria bacterium]
MDRLDNAAVFAETVLGIVPHAGQARYLLDRHPTKTLVGGRRSGKTISLAIEIAFHAAKAVHAHRPFRQLLVAPGIDQAKLLIAAVARLIRQSPLGGLIEAEFSSPFPELRLAGGVLIFVRAAHEGGKHLRGHAADRVVVDEAAYVPDTVIEEAIMPLLADVGGELVLASTPSTKGSLFHRMFERGRSGTDARVSSFIIRSADNPYIDRGYVEGQRAEITDRQFRVEYGGEFLDQTDAVFRWDHVVRCTGGEQVEAGAHRRCVIGWDPALKRDRSGVAIIDATGKPLRCVHVEDIRGRDFVEQVQRVAELARLHGGAKVVVDGTGQGAVLVELLRRQGCWVEGVTFTTATKAEIVTALAVAIENGGIILPPNRDLLDELRFYEARAKPSGRIEYGAPVGGRIHDDLTTALALALRGVQGPPQARTFADAGLLPFLTSSRGAKTLAVGPDGLPDRWSSWPWDG